MSLLFQQNSPTVHIPFHTFIEDCKQFAEYIEERFKPKYLFGVPRGGLIVACWASYYMKSSPQVYPVYVKVKCARCGANHLTDSPVVRVKPGDIIIDDIYDKGATLRDLTTEYGDARMCILYSKKRYLDVLLSESYRKGRIFINKSIVTDKYVILPFEGKGVGETDA